ncbi:hypothetical protein C5167_016112 [Papaver somniferum]|nr:hypothetical protein C5167_016112 [Papaver somniferum]
MGQWVVAELLLVLLPEKLQQWGNGFWGCCWCWMAKCHSLCEPSLLLLGQNSCWNDPRLPYQQKLNPEIVQTSNN